MENKAFETTEIVAFGSCQIRVGAREIVTGGKIREIEPRAFDVLLYLLFHSDRVVSKDELLKEVWHTAFASDTVVAQCIMKIRRAISDDNPDQPLIKTIQRAGYRFVGNFSRGADTVARSRSRSQRAGKEPKRIAVLPVAIAAAPDSMSRIEFGIASVIVRAFQLEGGVTTVPLLEIAKVLDDAYFDLPIEQRVGLLHETLEIDGVLSATAKVGEDSESTVEYTVYPVNEAAFHGSCTGASLTAICAQLVSTVIAEFGKRYGATSSGPFEDDPFLSEAWSRALAAARHNYRDLALSYFQICVDAVPHELSVDVEYVKQLAEAIHPTTPQRATEVLERAALVGDSGAATSIFRALSTYYTGAVLDGKKPPWLRPNA